MNTKKLFGLAGVGLFSAVLMSAPAFAWDFGSRRADIHHDRRALRHDRHELWHDYRYGAAPGDIAHERAEIRDDLRELGRDHGSYWRGRDWDRDDWRHEPYRRGWFDRFGWWR